ncbi:MAG: LysR family transcriptional regulator [Oscillospiraceae bacterium]
MDISYFREFTILAETGSYSLASEKLYISQSTLSKHIKNFEAELGQQLFERTTRKIELTRFGQHFLTYARQILTIQDAYTKDLLHFENNLVTLGLVSALVKKRFIDIIIDFRREYPQYDINLIDSDSLTLVKRLYEKKCDFAIIHELDSEETHTPEYQRVPIEKNHLVVILPSSHRLAGRESIEIAELKDEPFIFLSEQTFMYSLAVTLCRRAGFEPNIILTSPRRENILQSVEYGLGVSILSREHIPAHDNVRLVNIAPCVTSSLNLCYRRETLSPAAGAFLRWIQEHLMTEAP